jgi:hypothetical protein
MKNYFKKAAEKAADAGEKVKKIATDENTRKIVTRKSVIAGAIVGAATSAYTARSLGPKFAIAAAVGSVAWTLGSSVLFASWDKQEDAEKKAEDEVKKDKGPGEKDGGTPPSPAPGA